MVHEPPVATNSYRFSDLTISVTSDSPLFARFFADLHHAFRVPDPGPAALAFELSAAQGILSLAGETLLQAEPDLLFPAACERILDLVAAHTARHIMIHAGAVSWGSAGTLIPGYSYHGKTTLILELVRRGFGFLSDEIAALDRTTGLVDPFPRRPRVWPRTLALLDAAGIEREPGELVPGPGGKVVLDVERLRPGTVGRPVQPAYLVALWNPANDANPIDRPERTWYVVLNRLPPDLVGRIATVPNILSVAPVPEAAGGVVLRLVIPRGEARVALDQVAGLARAAGAVVLDEVKGGQWAPDFETVPALEPMSAVDAAVELVRHFRGGPDSRLLQGAAAIGPSRLFLELAGLAGRLTPYRLRVGRLDAMADLICDLAAGRRAG
jgi:hypothetical protein